MAASAKKKSAHKAATAAKPAKKPAQKSAARTIRKLQTAKQAKQPPLRAGSPAARYGILIAICILVAISLIMAFSASSNEAVIRQVHRENLAAQQDSIEQTAIAELPPEITDPGELAADSSPVVDFVVGLFNSAYASGFRQMVFVLLGVAAAFVISRIDYRKIAPFATPAAAVLLAALLFLLFFGQPVLGSVRWFNFGLFAVQPSEFAKPILLVLLAYYCSRVKDEEEAGSSRAALQADLPFWQRDWALPAALVLGCLAAILFSPDVGTTMIICVGLFVAYVLAGWPWLRVVIGGAILATIYTIRTFAQGGYASTRLTDFMGKWIEGVTPHQTYQAELALGSGGITGLGPGLSRQKFAYLPEAQNDFIIAVVGEELGLIGVSLILAAFALILYGGLSIASRAKDRLGQTIAGGATVLIVFQALLNIFAVVSLGPVTGKPLPFVTLGGSSMISTFILVGLLFSVARFGCVTPKTAAAATGGSSGRTPSATSAADGQDKQHDKKARRQRTARRRARARSTQDEVDDDEDDIEWRWNSGAHLSGSGTRRPATRPRL
ncbi:MAG: FtsW/RodA/SpoVE family cell cycle protein [Coriobacteriia bacterium]|nr:FtsW/RodA/SpoVE family cell cycle protein [Coriobacteriia bacterium]